MAAQGYRCDSGDYFHKMGPATWFMFVAMKTFQGRLGSFRIVMELTHYDVMETSKYCHWVTPNAAMPIFWQGSLGRSINDFPKVYFSMTDVMAEMKEARTDFKVILRGIDWDRRFAVGRGRYPDSRSANKTTDVGPWTSDQELCDRDITDLWHGEAFEEARDIVAMQDSCERRDRERDILQLGSRFGCPTYSLHEDTR